MESRRRGRPGARGFWSLLPEDAHRNFQLQVSLHLSFELAAVALRLKM